MNGWMMRAGAVDTRIHQLLLRTRRPYLTRAMFTVTRLGDPPSLLLVGVLLLLAPLPLPVGVAAHGALGGLATFVVSQVLKRVISRPRPELPVGLKRLIHPPDQFSFPSGHAAVSLAMALPLALALPMGWGVALVTIASVVGISRAYLGVHYPGDVVAGWLLALAASHLVGGILGVGGIPG